MNIEHMHLDIKTLLMPKTAVKQKCLNRSILLSVLMKNKSSFIFVCSFAILSIMCTATLAQSFPAGSIKFLSHLKSLNQRICRRSYIIGQGGNDISLRNPSTSLLLLPAVIICIGQYDFNTLHFL